MSQEEKWLPYRAVRSVATGSGLRPQTSTSAKAHQPSGPIRSSPGNTIFRNGWPPANRGNAWEFTLAALDEFFDRIISGHEVLPPHGRDAPGPGHRFRLGQVLATDNDFVIIDFEGEPARTIRERRLKASPLRDVSGMLRSFDYAGHAARGRVRGGRLAEQDRLLLGHWVQFWTTWTSAAYLRAYLAVAAGASFLPRDSGNLEALLDAYLCEKALYELQYELNNRPDWAHIPLQGLSRLLE